MRPFFYIGTLLKTFLLLFLLAVMAVPAYTQPACFAEMTLDRQSVYIQQPLRVTITVLTATWYVSPLEFDDIRIPHAFILPFQQTTPGMFLHGGRQYAGLQFYFIVFPFTEGEFEIPAVRIVAHTPPPGSSKGMSVTVSTGMQHFFVRPLPAEAKEDWFVAKNVTVSGHWSRSLRDLKVGDVIERTFSIRAEGTLPQFIPPVTVQQLDFAETYPQDPQWKDQRTDYDANGSLTQRLVYLLEKEGDFVFPDLSVTWWNPNSGKSYSRGIPGAGIHVKANAALGMLTTLKDSLRGTRTTTPAIRQQERTFLGMAWYWAVLFVIMVAAFLHGCFLAMTGIYFRFADRRARYRAGELYAFRRLLRSSLSDPSFIRNMYAWWDRLPQPPFKSNYSVLDALEKSQNAPLREAVTNLLRRRYDGDEGVDLGKTLIKKYMKTFRRQLLNRLTSGETRIGSYQP